MPSTEHHKLDRVFEWRLKVALDRIVPPPAFPRYASKSMGGVRPWRIAPALLASATIILVALAATATTGSPNPAVWTGDAASTIGAVGHVAEASPSPQPSPAPPPPAAPRKAVAPAPAPQPEPRESPRPVSPERPEESPRPQPTVSPSPWEDHSGSSWPSPSPWPGEH
jgi:hypothetical protein